MINPNRTRFELWTRDGEEPWQFRGEFSSPDAAERALDRLEPPPYLADIVPAVEERRPNPR